jgi:uncharacterized protein
VVAELAEAIELFNHGEFYACHDALEALWVEAPVDEKKFYQGLLQIAVAFHHLGNKNLRGATVLLGEGRFRLVAYQPSYCPEGQELPAPVDVQQVRGAAQEFLALLQVIADPADLDRLLAEIATGHRQYPQILLALA